MTTNKQCKYCGLPKDNHPATRYVGECTSETFNMPTPRFNANGEFECQYCSIIIGKNLNGDMPYSLAYEHFKKYHPATIVSEQQS